jgi:uncharacterized hydrophobic protein (TIGR00271 family)
LENLQNKSSGRKHWSVIFSELALLFKERLSLHEDQESEYKTIESISKAIVFRGTNLWILIFAILVASIGLNVNSTAVIIGAMLISPLMGPIMGAGLSIGINDFALFQKSIKNLGIMTFVGILVSALYFWMTPIQESTSELLARTYPTIYDVFIAFFGGFAGIVAGSRLEKGNAIPGVAIATALMPPLCTVGYGLAMWEPSYFFGALYLYFINCTFICLSTLIFVRYMKFPKKHFLDPLIELKTKRYVYLITFLMAAPSIYLAYKLVNHTRVEANVNRFVTEVVEKKGYSVLKKSFIEKRDSSVLDLTVFGKRIENQELALMRERMSDYSIGFVHLVVNQGFDSTSFSSELLGSQLKSNILADLYDKNMALLESKEEQIRRLEKKIEDYQLQAFPVQNIDQELKIFYPSINHVSAGNLLSKNTEKGLDTVPTIVLKSSTQFSTKEKVKIEEWLETRLNQKSVTVLFQ